MGPTEAADFASGGLRATHAHLPLRAGGSGRDIYFFVDNEAAAAALIRGASGQDDVGAVAQAVHWKLHCLGARMWVEWIDSDSNPSDGLSRDGFDDQWTLSHDWELEVAPKKLLRGALDFRRELRETLG